MLSIVERAIQKNVFTCVRKEILEDNTEETQCITNRGTHRICNLETIETCMNKNVWCYCEYDCVLGEKGGSLLRNYVDGQ